MATVTVRPDSTPTGASNFTIVGGAASINAALSDDNVATYVKKGVTGNGAVIVGFADTTIASNVRVKQVRIRSQVLCPTTASRLRITPIVRVSGVNYFGAAQTFSGSFTLAEYSAGYFTTAPDGQAWDQTRVNGLRAQIQDNASGADLSNVYELFFDIDTTTQPTVTVSSPTGTVTNTDRPDVLWTYADADGTSQDYYQVRVFSSAQYSATAFDPATSTATWESGIVASDDNSVTIQEYLTKSTTYRAYVRVAKIVSGVPFYSDYAYSQFIVNATEPGTPTLTSASYSSVANRVYLQTTAASIAGLFTSQVLQMQRSDNSASSWADIIGGSAIVPSGSLSAVIYDYAAPRGKVVQYRVRSIGNLAGDLAASPWSTSASVTITNDATWWIKAVSDPTLNQGSLRIRAALDTKVDEQIGIFNPIGRRTAVTVSAGLQGKDGVFNITAAGSANFTTVWNLLSHTGDLIVQYPDGTQKFIRINNRSYKQSGPLKSLLTDFTVDYVEIDV